MPDFEREPKAFTATIDVPEQGPVHGDLSQSGEAMEHDPVQAFVTDFGDLQVKCPGREDIDSMKLREFAGTEHGQRIVGFMALRFTAGIKNGESLSEALDSASMNSLVKDEEGQFIGLPTKTSEQGLTQDVKTKDTDEQPVKLAEKLDEVVPVDTATEARVKITPAEQEDMVQTMFDQKDVVGQPQVTDESKATKTIPFSQREVFTSELQADLGPEVFEATVANAVLLESVDIRGDTLEQPTDAETADAEDFVLEIEAAPAGMVEQPEVIAFEPGELTAESIIVPEHQVVGELVDTIITEAMEEVLPAETAFEIEPESEAAVTIDHINKAIEQFVELSAEVPMTLEVLETKLEEFVEALFEQLDLDVTPEQKHQLLQRFVQQAVDMRAKQILGTQLEEGTHEHKYAGMHLPHLIPDIDRANLAATFLVAMLLKLKPAN